MTPDNISEDVQKLYHCARWRRGMLDAQGEKIGETMCLAITVEDNETKFEEVSLLEFPSDKFIEFFSFVIGSGQANYIFFITDAQAIVNPTKKEIRKLKTASELQDFTKAPERSKQQLSGTLFSAEGPQVYYSSSIEACKNIYEAYEGPTEVIEDIETVRLFEKNPKYGWQELNTNEEGKSFGASLPGWSRFSEFVEKAAETIAGKAGIEGWQ